ncbi:MAG: PDZ domain-containing protein, partial [Desulfomonilia bacterium]
APFRNKVALIAPGTTVKITVIRDNTEETFSVAIEELSPAQQAATTTPASLEKLGLTVSNLTPELADRFGYQGETGVIVTQVDPSSAAASAGIRPGVLIQEVNREKIQNVKEFEQALEKNGKKPILLFIKDERGSHYVALDPGK